MNIFSLILIILLLVGCKKNDYITCNIDIHNDIQGYKMKGIYKIYYKNNYVTRIEKEEKYISNNKTMIDYFNEKNELEYNDLNKYGEVIYEIRAREDFVKIKATINLLEFDISSMVKDNKISKDYVISNRLTTSGIKSFYESKGAVCE